MVETYKLDFLEMKCMPSVCRMTRMNRWRNEEVRRCFGAREKVNLRAVQKVLKPLGDVERMNGEQLTKKNIRV